LHLRIESDESEPVWIMKVVDFMAEKRNKPEEQKREECVEYLKKEWNDPFYSLSVVHL